MTLLKLSGLKKNQFLSRQFYSYFWAPYRARDQKYLDPFRVSLLNSFLLSFLARRDSPKSFLSFWTKQIKFLIKKFLIKKSVYWKNAQFSHKRTKIQRSTALQTLKLSMLVHFLVIQKRYSVIFKILFFQGFLGDQSPKFSIFC